MNIEKTLTLSPGFSAGSMVKAIALMVWMALSKPVAGQIIYATGEIPPLTPGVLIKINLADCTFCPASIVNDPTDYDITLLPNGNFVNASNIFIRVFDPPAQDPVSNLNIYPQVAVGNILSPSGTLYIATQQGLGIFNPVTNQFSYLGDWPPSFQPVVEMELWFQGSQLFGYFGFPVQQVAQIDVNAPGNSVVTGSINASGFIQAACNIGGTVYLADEHIVYTYDPASGNLTTLCDFSGTPLLILGLSSVPANFPDYPCLCSTNAGSVAPQGLVNYCVNEPAVLLPNGDQALDNNDLLQYVLFSNPNDTAGSILQISSSPNFTFAPPMQTGVPYYVAAAAGNNTGGAIDLNDPCLDFSNANPIIWRPLPAIVLSSGNPNVCETGGCADVTATLSGTPPFTFTYTLQKDGAPVGSPVVVNAASSPVTFTVCPPPGTAAGPLQVVVCSVSDAYCTNP